jgi:hypothetical protein
MPRHVQTIWVTVEYTNKTTSQTQLATVFRWGNDASASVESHYPAGQPVMLGDTAIGQSDSTAALVT